MQYWGAQPWSVSKVLHLLLTVIFMLWLIHVFIQSPHETESSLAKKINQQLPDDITLEQHSLPALPLSANTNQERSVSKSETLGKKPIERLLAINKQQVEQVYRQLTDEGLDIQIAWPQKASEQQATLDFMYRCAHMQFAVLKENKVTRVNQLELSDYSEWIRLAQGNLSKKERNWLKAYALEGQAIRLFPSQIDLRLAQHLALSLNGTPLAKLRANYLVINQTFYLSNIWLNNQPVKGNWLLYKSNC